MHGSSGDLDSIQHLACQHDYIFVPATFQFREEVPCVVLNATELAVPENVKNPHGP
jgi:hypothetical protein